MISNVQTGPGLYPLCVVGIFALGQNSQNVKLTIYLYLVLTLRIHETSPPLTHVNLHDVMLHQGKTYYSLYKN